MDTNQNQTNDKLDFMSFIKEYYTDFKIDQYNRDVISNLGLWANRNEKFNGKEQGWHIDRGILLSGPVGTGKDEMFRVLRRYLAYLGSPYGYDFKVVWKFASEFTKEGYACFHEETGNRYYEELALTDEKTKEATREYVSHFGNKLLIGSELIHVRSKVFKETACQTHFSTNLNEEDLEAIYGNRCISRLWEMCNFMFLTGKNRRGTAAPTFLKNKNIASKPAPRETTVDEHMENKSVLEKEYQMFCDNGDLSETATLNFNLLTFYGCNVATEDEMRSYMESVAPGYQSPASEAAKSNGDKEKNRQHFIWANARRLAVARFYERLKLAGAKSIFQEVDITGVVKDLSQEKKS